MEKKNENESSNNIDNFSKISANLNESDENSYLNSFHKKNYQINNDEIKFGKKLLKRKKSFYKLLKFK